MSEIKFSKRRTIHLVATMPEGCTVNSETDRALYLDVDKPRAEEVAKLLRAMADYLDAEAKKP